MPVNSIGGQCESKKSGKCGCCRFWWVSSPAMRKGCFAARCCSDFRPTPDWSAIPRNFGKVNFSSTRQPRRADFTYVVQSWDTGQSELPTSDYSVRTTRGLSKGVWHLIDVYRGRIAFRELRRQAIYLHRKWKTDKIIIESTASGIGLIDDLRGEHRLRAEVRADHLDRPVRVTSTSQRTVLPFTASMPKARRF